MSKMCVSVAVMALLTTCAFGTPVSCSTVTTWGALTSMNSDGCVSGDKIFSSFSGSVQIPDAWSASISSLILGASDYHKIQLAVSPTGSPLQGGMYDISYYVAIDPNAMDFATLFITSVQISADINPNGGDTTVAKEIFDTNGNSLGTVQTTSGGSAILSGFSLKGLEVSETLNVGPNSNLNSFTDTFVQTKTAIVAEPVSLVLVGTGLLGLALVGRRLTVNRRVRSKPIRRAGENERSRFALGA